MPRILYHSEEALLDALEDRHRQKREPVTMTLALLLGLGGAALRVGTGTAALIQGSQQLAQLQLAIDTDLRAIENSISLLEKSHLPVRSSASEQERVRPIIPKRQGPLCGPRRRMFLRRPCWNSKRLYGKVKRQAKPAAKR